MNLKTPIESKRLVLRPLKRTDLGNYRELVSLPKLAKAAHFKRPKNGFELRLMFNDDLKKSFTDVIILKRSTRWLGLVSLYPQIGKRFEPTVKTLGLGYMLKPKYQGRGYMTEALGSLIKNLRLDHRVKQLRAVTYRCNQRSVAVLKHNGFVSYHEIVDFSNHQTELFYQLELAP